MTIRGLKFGPLMALLAAVSGTAVAQPTVAPSAVSFNYQMGASPLLQTQKVVITLPAANASQTLTVTNVVVALFQTVGSSSCTLGQSNTGCGWLSVTPSSGHSPLTVIVTGNPSTLTAGSYTGSFTISTTTAPFNPVTVNVTLAISNPPSQLEITSTSFPVNSSGVATPTLAYSYTTGAAATTLTTSEVDVSSTGDIIPFTVATAVTSAKGGTASSNWLRVALISGGSGLAATSASSSAFPGSYAGITVSLDYATISGLDPAGSPYSGAITIAATSPVNGSYTVTVTLNVVAGAPTAVSIFPTAVNAQLPGMPAANNYIFTLVGTNFFTTSAVSLQQTDSSGNVIGQSIPLPQPTYLSQQVLQVTVNPAYFAVPVSGVYPVYWQLKLANPATASNPSPAAAYFNFTEVDPTQPTISGVVNAGSYQPASVWSGGGTDPLASATSQVAVAPREIISIFGQNLGPAMPSTANLLSKTCADGISICFYYGPTWSGVSVTFSYTDTSVSPSVVRTYNAPILMTYTNQVNCIVPKEMKALFAIASQAASITLTNNLSVTTATPFPVTVLPENPGMFTFGSLGQGQGAVINYDATGTITSVNSSKNTEPRGDTVAIYVTGLGELTDSTVGSGDIVATATNAVADQTVRVVIGGQPCVVTYAGTAELTVAGLVQINAVVPVNAATGSAQPIVVSIGASGASRSTQSGVTMGVK